MRLFIFISLSFLEITGSSVCVHQMKTCIVQSGGSVTIPCSYSDPGIPDEDVRVIWGETDKEYCSSTAAEDAIISPSGNVTEKYEGRLSRKKDPLRNRTEYITITGLHPRDGPRFCCQLYNIKSNYIFKDSRHSTLLQFPGTEFITQMDEVMAVPDEEVIIPCYYSKNTPDITKVTWYYADKESHYCTHTSIYEWSNAREKGRYSLVNFTQDISLRIHNIVVTDERSYCCVISTARARLESKQFTRLVVSEYQSSWDQPTHEISVQEERSALLSCSYTPPSGQYTERDVMRVNVYWRVGNVTGPYAYHPYQKMVHSTYRHRTSIIEMTSLMIMDVTKADNTSFHCFVVLKLCAGDYQYEDKIQYGGGTRLIIKGDVAGRTINGKNDFSEDGKLTFEDLMIIIVVSSVTVMIILIVILIILKVKGVICRKKTNFSEQQMDSIQAAGEGAVTSEEAPYCEISTKKQEDVLKAATDETGKTEMESGGIEDGEEGNLLYAKLNQTKLKEKRPAENPKQNEEVVYAAVVNTTPK